MRKKIFILLIIAITSCNFKNHKNIEGSYYSRSKHIELHMYSQDSFLFIQNIPYQKYSKGKWNLSENGILLDSYENFKTGYVEWVIEKIIDNEDSLYIEIFHSEGFPLGLAGISFDEKNQNYIHTNEEGKGFLRKFDDVNKFNIYYLGHKYEYKVQNINANYFSIYLNIKDQTLEYFKNELINLKNNKLLFKNITLKNKQIRSLQVF